MKKFAVFDIDGTIFRFALFHSIVDQLVLDGFFSEKTANKIEQGRKSWRTRSHPEAFWDYVETSVDAYFKSIKDLTQKQFKKVVDEVFDREKDHVYVYTRELIKDFKQKGRKSWLAELALNPEGIPSTGNQSYYGLGWRVTLRNGEIFSMHHYGDWHKGVCIFYVFPLHSASFAYVATPPDYSARQVQNVKLALINYAQDYADSLDRTSNPQVSSSGLNIIKDKSKLYIGSYTNSRTNESVNIFSKDGQLYLKRSDREVPLKYLSDWEFEGDSTEYSVQFYFDENAKVRAVIDMGDYFQKN